MSSDSKYALSVDEFIRLALLEDTGDGDHTSLATVGDHDTGTGNVKVKEDGIICGMELAKHVLHAVDRGISIETRSSDGRQVKKGDIVLIASGTVRSLLRAERLLLNCMQRMSGIATLTNHYAKAVADTGAKILDTRKTTPNFRQFEKQAVLAGGGFNHRFGLYDMILIKDNHVDAAGGIRQALERTKKYLQAIGKKLRVEIETRNMEEVREVLETGIADRIMLDNFSIEALSEAVRLIDHRLETEASGGITLDNVRQVAEAGVDFISVGALTHSYRSLDISMKISNRTK